MINRYKNFDILKLCLALLVVMRHMGQSFFSEDSLFHYVFTNTLSTIAVPTFFLISGFLFFSKENNSRRLFRQIKRVLLLYILWSIVFLPINFSAYINNGQAFFYDLIDYLKNAIFLGTYYHLWFLPSLIVALIFVYILGKWFSTKKVLVITLGLFLIGLFTNTYISMLPEKFSELYEIYTDIFITSRNGVFFAGFFIAFGRYIAENKKKISITKLSLVLLISFCCLFAESLFAIKVADKSVNNILLFAAVSAVCVFLLALSLEGRHSISVESCRLMRELSTFIFCSHPWVIYISTLVGRYTVLGDCNLFLASLTILLQIVLSCSFVFLSIRFEALKKFV